MLKIVSILNQLPDQTFHKFSLFLQSPYHNSNKQLIKLLQVRKKGIDSIEEINTKILKKKKLNPQVVRNYLSDLSKKFKSFLIINQLETEESLQEVLLIKKMKSIGLEEKLILSPSKLKRQEDTTKSFHAIQLHDTIFQYHIERRPNLPPTLGASIDSEFQSLQIRNRVTLISFYCTYLSLKNKPPNFILNEEIENAIASFEPFVISKKSLLLDLYEYSLDLARNPSKESFMILHKKLFLNLEQLHIDHIKFVASNLGNYCIKQINSGDSSYSNYFFEYMYIRLTYSLDEILEDQLISNFVTVGCRINKIEEVLNFVEGYKSKINQHVYTFSKAIISLYKKEYDKVLEILTKTTFSDVGLIINSKHILISTFIALNETEAALNAMEAFRVQLLRSKNISTDRKKRNLTFLKFLKAAFLLKEKKDILGINEYHKQITNLKDKILAANNVFNKELLINFLTQA